MEFSRRTGWDRTENALARAVAGARATGRLFDLTAANPTAAGLPTDLAPLIAELGHPRGAAYAPEPFGHPRARAAVSAYYAARGVAVPGERVVVTASTSESYAWLFKLLCDPGTEVLVPAPSYPLLGFLADLEGVTLVPFRLELRGDRFRVDWSSVQRAAGPRARAMVFVHPNNPTGSFVADEDRARAMAFARDRDLAIVVDEVFADYAHDEAAPFRTFATAGEDDALTFALSGLSKAALLPQLKLGWMALAGPGSLVEEARARLELVADSYLSVGTPVQLALPAILERQPALAAALRARLRDNLAILDAHVGHRRLPVEAGWYAIVATDVDDDALTADLLARDGVLVHPGYFFDFAEPGRIVVSLLAPPDVMAVGARAVARALASAPPRA